jgi:hypothetical protein
MEENIFEFEALFLSGYSVFALLPMSMLDCTISQPLISTQYKATLVYWKPTDRSCRNYKDG